jgi:hypothetical protein
MAPCLVGRATPSRSRSLAGPSRAPATATLWGLCRGVREESPLWPAHDRDRGVRPLGVHPWLYAFVHELGGTTPQPCDEGFRCRRDQVGAANHTRSHRVERPAVGALGGSLLSAHRFGTPKRSLAGSAKDGGDGSSTGIAARAIRRTRKKAGLSRPQGRAATFGRDGSGRTAASTELNVSRETLSSGLGGAHSGACG